MSATDRFSAAYINADTVVDGMDKNISFFFLVSLLERAHQCAQQQASSVVGQLGSDSQPQDESLRFKTKYDLAFRASSIASVKPAAAEGGGAVNKYLVVVNFIGLAGAAGVLPLHYTRLIMDRLKQRDKAMADFLDIFHHRLVSLFYRAWQKYKFTAQYESSLALGKKDAFSTVIESLAGVSEQECFELQSYYAGHFAKKVRTVSSLRAVLMDYFGLPVEVNSFKGQWLPIEKRDQFCLSSKAKKQRLGAGILLGKRCWDVQSKIEIDVGPMSIEQYQRKGPGTEFFKSACKLMNRFLPAHINADMHFKVENKADFSLPLGKGLRLQRNGWLKSTKKEPLIATVSINRNE
ncbi:type VI secretion system baseplate subunit TssG [Saccharophagus degradans]|uniref:type VI secretion system baseplate subunit TssG n=1 Tax=Saccharophagus degradans TaxID=86304 RepID=UPI002477DAA4|nr:type VI secretion system baseplate subunit TssG [Saccharophagus degradans]WGO97014.1 type VI secretion system baseplate subunit TssG [Saccharophagus degradans]